ncbi:MAG TPA: thioredoxin, partial [Herpetosiphonaceae bacterium]|nr:thioredoxin [Herpetosiphonaceae bacterium]
RSRGSTCAARKEEFMAGKTLAVTDETFEQEVLKSDKPVMVDFWAPWCGPCRAVAPILEDLANEYGDKIVIAKVNTDENPRYMMQYGIMAIPTMIFFKDGQLVDMIQGAGPKSFYKTRLDAILNGAVAAKS